jgi:hypothetical protein
MKNKFFLLFPVLFLALAGGHAFADLNFRFYPGLYMGADWGRDIGDGMITIGGDMQLGLELGEFDYDDFVFGFFGDMGLDTGQPNEPNFYYGIMAEVYFNFWGDDFKVGTALGIGSNAGFDILKNNDRLTRDSSYIRIGFPVHFTGKTKYGFYFDFYPDIGSRLGIMIHF